jgi:hypothetical protein
MDTEKRPLGYVSLLNDKQKAVYPLDDIFVNYTFEKEENWANLRTMINIILDAYSAKYNRRDGFHYVDEAVVVRTQYQHYVKNTSKQPTQDIKIDEHKAGNLTFVEVQNKAASNPPISIRASEYSGLAINKAGRGAAVSQIWLLGENDENVLHGQTISNYRMVEENTGEYYPRALNTMFVSLPRLARETGLGGELSRVLTGEAPEPENLSDEIKGIAEMFSHEFESFKRDEEVVKVMTIVEEKVAMVKSEYTEMHEKIIIDRMKRGVSMSLIKDLAKDMGISAERFKELHDANKGARTTGRDR